MLAAPHLHVEENKLSLTAAPATEHGIWRTAASDSRHLLFQKAEFKV